MKDCETMGFMVVGPIKILTFVLILKVGIAIYFNETMPSFSPLSSLTDFGTIAITLIPGAPTYVNGILSFVLVSYLFFAALVNIKEFTKV